MLAFRDRVKSTPGMMLRYVCVLTSLLVVLPSSFSRPSVVGKPQDRIAPREAPLEMPQLLRPAFPSRTWNIRDYSAVEGGIVKNTEARGKAVAEAAKAGSRQSYNVAAMMFHRTIPPRTNLQLGLL
jgi:hypothetical protein